MYGEVLESGRSGGASNNSGRGGRRLVYRQEHDAAGRTRQVAAKPSAARVQLGDGGFNGHLTDGLAGLAPSKRRHVSWFKVRCNRRVLGRAAGFPILRGVS